MSLTKAELDAVLWALGNFVQAGDYRDTHNDKRLWSAMARAYEKLLRERNLSTLVKTVTKQPF